MAQFRKSKERHSNLTVIEVHGELTHGEFFRFLESSRDADNPSLKAVFDLLSEQHGIARQKFETVHAPIGLDIGAETPAEIAVCIIAEIINLYRGGRAQTLSQALRANQGHALHPKRQKKAKKDRDNHS